MGYAIETIDAVIDVDALVRVLDALPGHGPVAVNGLVSFVLRESGRPDVSTADADSVLAYLTHRLGQHRGARYATDREAADAGERVIERHHAALERLNDTEPRV